MARFTVWIEETATYKISVNAGSIDEATALAHEDYGNGAKPWDYSAETGEIICEDDTPCPECGRTDGEHDAACLAIS